MISQLPVIPSKESSYGHLNMAKSVYGQDSTDDRNGSIAWHTVVELLKPGHFPKDAQRPHQVRYIVGTPPQVDPDTASVDPSDDGT